MKRLSQPNRGFLDDWVYLRLTVASINRDQREHAGLPEGLEHLVTGELPVLEEGRRPMEALILAADGVEDCELLYPYYRLHEAGIGVDVAAPEKGEITGKHGYTVEANLDFWDLHPGEYDLLVLPGGSAPETVRVHDRALETVQEIFAADKPVAAICHGAQVLISAGLLEGKRATCWAGIRDDLKAAGAEYVDRDVVVDGNLITSRQPDDLPAFCRELLRTVQQAGS